ncbi:MAG: PLP-dependent aminotransferase family protein [Comamonadaceae bacterium]|nr:MAG: PLP-dependent aminotransferase family protein [Comamonadaceae bacterium]
MQKRLGQDATSRLAPGSGSSNNAPAVDLSIDRSLALPMYLQIRHRFKTAIEQGHLRPGHRIAAARALASELGVARGTVEMAYRLLADEGYLLMRGAAGTVVSPALPGAALSPARPTMPEPDHAVNIDHDGKTPRPLQMGLPALDAFPRKVWNRLVGLRLRASNPTRLAYPHPAGYDELRQRIATYLGISRGVSCLPEQVFVTTGFRASLELTLNSLSNPGDAFWFEDPGYILARPFLQHSGLSIVPVPVDANGMDVEAGLRMAPQAAFAMVTPSHQSPLGVTLSLQRRMALLEWAARQNSWIIEDDYDSEFRYQGRPLPALKSLDRNDRVVYSGTFSKVMFPGLRLAYVVAPARAVPRFEAVAHRLNAGCPYLLQAGVADFIAQGHFFRHLKKMRHLYAERRSMTQRVFNDVLREHLHIELMPGGMHILAKLVDSTNDLAIGDQMRLGGLASNALSRWFIDAAPQHGLLFGFANIADEQQAMQIALRVRQAIELA